MAYLIGFIFSTCIAYIAFYKKSLNQSGFFAAIVFGTLIYAWGTHVIFILLMSFFISSSILTKFQDMEKEKHGRHWIQVSVNGLGALIFSFMHMITNETESIYLVLAACAIAISNADTWASEIGKLSKKDNVSILTFKPISKHESGGITLLGMIASILGALWIMAVYLFLYGITYGFELIEISHALIILLSGILGSILDSVLGILIQEKYQHQHTLQMTENRLDSDESLLISGIKYINNDAVNLITSIVILIILSMILLI